ncbi:MAG: hypothetical protein KF813_14690 [Trueperaceae bacterium]|nr:hypothetical protein [Trueperaceae bacterium]
MARRNTKPTATGDSVLDTKSHADRDYRSVLMPDTLRATADSRTEYDAVWEAEERFMAEISELVVGEIFVSRSDLHER